MGGRGVAIAEMLSTLQNLFWDLCGARVSKGRRAKPLMP